MPRDRISDEGHRRRRTDRKLAERAFLSVARSVGRPGMRVFRPEAGPPAPARSLFSDLVELRLPLAGRPGLPFEARLVLPDADGLIERTLALLDGGRRHAEAAIEAEVRLYGLAGAGRAAAACAPALAAFGAAIDRRVAEEGPAFAAAFVPLLAARLARALPDALDPALLALLLPGALDLARSEALLDLEERRRLEAVTAMAGFARYPDLFPEARAMRRRLVLILGPTNSGKTHEALSMAAAAGRAEVLAPLRLLALEHFERMQAMGLPAGMVTGEETIDADGATHVARTIEAADLDVPVELAVIDEIQMLADPHRGWAWTQALLGVPARTVVMTGSPDALPLVEAAASMTGEALEVRYRERRLPLRAAPRPVGIRGIEAGDAVIAFSRRSALALREELQAEGHEVAMVYGNLAPDVRRAEAARFRSGAADVLVATDAIGMGLNLPIRRVVFSALSKFDGRTQRDLTPSEIRQIAGRAGRFGGPADEGVCAVMPGAEPRRLAAAIDDPARPGADLRLYVRPSLSAVLAVAGREPVLLAPILAHLRDNLVAGHPELRMADIDFMVEAAALVDRHALPLATRYAYATCPLASAEADDLRALDGWAAAHAAGEAVACPDLDVEDLAAAETSGRRMMAYCWMARRFPHDFPEAGLAGARRLRAEEAVEGYLRENPWRRGPRRAA